MRIDRVIVECIRLRQKERRSGATQFDCRRRNINLMSFVKCIHQTTPYLSGTIEYILYSVKISYILWYIPPRRLELFETYVILAKTLPNNAAKVFPHIFSWLFLFWTSRHILQFPRMTQNALRDHACTDFKKAFEIGSEEYILSSRCQTDRWRLMCPSFSSLFRKLWQKRFFQVNCLKFLLS